MSEIPRIRRSPVPLSECNLSKSFELIGDHWTLLILRSALYGIRRFDDFQGDLDIPRTILSNRLAGLVESGIMERREYREHGQRSRVEYPLTKMGLDLRVPFIAITDWGDRYLGDGECPLQFWSKKTGQRVSIGFVDGTKIAMLKDIETVIVPRKSACTLRKPKRRTKAK